MVSQGKVCIRDLRLDCLSDIIDPVSFGSHICHLSHTLYAINMEMEL